MCCFKVTGLSNQQRNLTDGKICYNFLSMVGRFTCQSEVRVQWAVPDASDFNAHDNSLMIIHTRPW